MENFGRYVAIVLVVGLAFVMSIAYQAENLSEIQRIYLIEKGEEFVEKVTVKKEITIFEWEQFFEELNRCGRLCVAEFTIGTVKENGIEVESAGDYFEMVYDYEIKKKLHERGSYVLKSGQFFTVEIYERKNGVKRVYFERARKVS